jgi:ketosteroid isomerase-like protein
MTKKSIAKSFSNGEFENVFDFLAENAVWEVVEENTFHGKKAIIENCKQVAAYFQTVTTHFEILNVIAEDNRVAVNGTAEFIKGGNRVSFVKASDLYEFNDQQHIQKITSYCIQAK